MPTDALTAKERKAIELFVEYGNKAQAYREVYKSDSPSNALSERMSRILAKPKAVEYLDAVRADYIKRFGDKFAFLLKELVDDIEYRDDDGKRSPTWQRSVELLQKQLGFQSQKIDANVSAPSIKIIIDGDENDGKN